MAKWVVVGEILSGQTEDATPLVAFIADAQRLLETLPADIRSRAQLAVVRYDAGDAYTVGYWAPD